MEKYSKEEMQEIAMQFLYMDGMGYSICGIMLEMLSKQFNCSQQDAREAIRKIAYGWDM